MKNMKFIQAKTQTVRVTNTELKRETIEHRRTKYSALKERPEILCSRVWGAQCAEEAQRGCMVYGVWCMVWGAERRAKARGGERQGIMP